MTSQIVIDRIFNTNWYNSDCFTLKLDTQSSLFGGF